MNEQKMTWSELCDVLSKDHTKTGVVVFKQNPTWKRKDYTLDELSYVVHGNNKHFYSNMISTSIWASNIAKNDVGVRLDWYMFYADEKERWVVDYCYLLKENN